LKKSHEKFSIQHIDPLGQGVSKDEDNIFFVHNSLEGEEGIADVDDQKKKIFFGHLSSPEKLSVISPKRIEPKCPHFFDCNGCHFLHTTYENEINIKKTNLIRNLSYYEKKTGHSIDYNQVITHASEDRFNTRNRIQLHYDLSKKRLGLIGHKKSQIIQVPDCLIGSKKIQVAIKNLYENNNWIKNIPKGAPRNGHIEIILTPGDKIDIIYNHPYSHGGFTQVNKKMNNILCSTVTMEANELFTDSDAIFDLFGGSGNLTKNLSGLPCLIYDSYGEGMLVERDGHQEFIKQNLYSHSAPEVITQKLSKYKSPGIIIDPPRSGLKNISDFLKSQTNVKDIIYVSCNPATLFRDIISIKEFKLKKIHLVDLFPCTYHYETICVLSKQ
jgi:23S rRNA (uracil1939-C5)-methyltransferase